MAFALVHFTVGFVVVLGVLSVVPLTRYRLTGAYAGGIVALGPDLHQLFGGGLGERLDEFHGSPRSDLFFLHHTLDTSFYRAHNVEFTFVSLVVLGLAYLLYDWRFGVLLRRFWVRGTAEGSDDPP